VLYTITSFLPDEDQGYFITFVQAPKGVSLSYTERLLAKAEGIMKQFSEIENIFAVGASALALMWDYFLHSQALGRAPLPRAVRQGLDQSPIPATTLHSRGVCGSHFTTSYYRTGGYGYVLPLVLASVAGAAARQSLGTAVMGGMAIATPLSLFIAPVLYIVIKTAQLRMSKTTTVDRIENSDQNSKPKTLSNAEEGDRMD